MFAKGQDIFKKVLATATNSGTNSNASNQANPQETPDSAETEAPQSPAANATPAPQPTTPITIPQSPPPTSHLQSTPKTPTHPSTQVDLSGFKKSTWEFQSLDLEQVVEDSPMSRDKMRKIEEDIDTFNSKLKKLIKMTKQIEQTSSQLNKEFKQFADDISDFSTLIGDDKIKNGFLKFAHLIKESENHRELMMMQMNTLLTSPMESFSKKEMEDLKEKKKKFERSFNNYDSALSKLSSVKRKSITPKDQSRTVELEQEVVDSRKDFRVNSLDFAFVLNDIAVRKNFEILECAAAFAFANLTFFHQGYELFNGASEEMKELTTYTHQKKKEYQTEKTEVVTFKRALESHEASVPVSSSPPGSPAKTSAKTLKGYLFKQGTGIRKDWKRRYFVIENGVLSYYRHGKDVGPVASLPLLLCSVKVNNDIDRRFCFEIISPEVSYMVQAESEQQMFEWISVIQNATADLLNNQMITKKSAYTGGTEAEDSKTSFAKTLTMLKSINPKNGFCADCGAEDPEWASINLGILVCIECSGFHRSMGVHISKVRSFTLDKWDKDLLKMMCSIGNENANKIFEAVVPEDVERPTPTSEKPVREKFIRMKYQEKKFVKPTELTQDALNLKFFDAAENNKVIETLEYLAQGANINFINEDHTALQANIIENSSVTAVEVLLVQNRADVNLQNSKGWTALHYAAFQGKTGSACFLFKNGAKLDIKTEDGHTPLDLAISNQKADAVTLLRLAQLAVSEIQHGNDDSFMEALQTFNLDSQVNEDSDNENNNNM